MDNQNPSSDAGTPFSNSPDRLQITANIRGYWQETSKWALFFAVLGFLYLAFIVVLVLFSASGGGMVASLITLLIVGPIVFFPTWFMYKFAQQTKQALDGDLAQAADEGFANLRRFYQFVGIFTIIALAFYLVMLLVVLSMATRSGGL